MPDISEALSNLELALEEQSAALAVAIRSADRAERIKLIHLSDRSWRRLLAAHRKLVRLTKNTSAAMA